MTTAYTTLLGLALPVQGELQGTWGDEVNNYITNYLDAAVAGTQTISGSQTAVTLSKTTGSSLSQAGSGATGSSQYFVINCTGNPAGTLTITAPAASKAYLIINATSTTQDVKIVGAGPTTGVTLVSGERAIVSWNGSDFVKVANFGGVGSFTTISATTGNITTVNSTTVDTTNIEVTNIKAKDGTASMTLADATGVATFSANPILNAGTANGVLYLNGSKVATSGSALTFDGGILTAPQLRTTNAAGAIFNTAAGAYVQWQYGAAAVGDIGTANQVVGSGATTDFAITSRGASGNLVFGINTTEQMRLTSTGLGIGTSSPGAKLESLVTSTTTPSLRLRYNASSYYADHLMNGNGDYIISSPASNGVTSGNLSIQAGAALKLFTNGSSTVGTAQLMVDSSGNLGLGVTPSAWGSSWSALQIGVSAALWAFKPSAGLSGTYLSNNNYFDGTNRIYTNTAAATEYAQLSGQHVWYTAPSGTAGNAISFTQALTLDASGNLLVGQTSGADAIEATRGGSTSCGLVLNQTGTSGRKYVIASTGSGYGAGNLIFYDYTAAAERARITSGGYFKASNNGSYEDESGSLHEFNTSVDNQVLSVRNTSTSNAAQTGGIGIKYSGAAPNNTIFEFLRGSDTGGTRFTVRSNGGIVNYQANDVNLSDRREKTNFAPAKSYLDTICAIPVQTFEYIDQSPDDPGLTLGVVAQDVQAVAPELVMESNWGTEDNPKMRLSIYQTDLQYALMKCIQELKAELDATKARLAALETN